VQAGCTLELGVRFRPDSELLAKCLLAGYATSDSDVIAVPVRLQVPGQVTDLFNALNWMLSQCFIIE
jgi:hypothetical protein